MTDTHKLVNDLSEQVTRLVKDELRLARMELTEKGKRAGFGAGLFGAAGMAAFFGGAALVAAVVMLLALVLPGWAAAAIVAGVLFIASAVLGLFGKNEVKRATPPVPEETIASVKADIDMVKERARR
ncbi:phage holin family protein [Nonomuraea sp. PA05]|uniref:phage holin family protein n=1 Tax=Nonomuraea sp. PA05 TaxID=2604466 RepID=UPI0011D9CCB3|nr:phage holin family protein [Nonomuraea sp. PA05]TYB68798.1 phage holin family protein [Nonomuraea sp. PA05]